MTSAYVNITERLAQMIPESVWCMKSAERLNIYEKLNLAAPAYILQE